MHTGCVRVREPPVTSSASGARDWPLARRGPHWDYAWRRNGERRLARGWPRGGACPSGAFSMGRGGACEQRARRSSRRARAPYRFDWRGCGGEWEHAGSAGGRRRGAAAPGRTRRQRRAGPVDGRRPRCRRRRDGGALKSSGGGGGWRPSTASRCVAGTPAVPPPRRRRWPRVSRVQTTGGTRNRLPAWLGSLDARRRALPPAASATMSVQRQYAGLNPDERAFLLSPSGFVEAHLSPASLAGAAVWTTRETGSLKTLETLCPQGAYRPLPGGLPGDAMLIDLSHMVRRSGTGLKRSRQRWRWTRRRAKGAGAVGGRGDHERGTDWSRTFPAMHALALVCFFDCLSADALCFHQRPHRRPCQHPLSLLLHTLLPHDAGSRGSHGRRSPLSRPWHKLHWQGPCQWRASRVPSPHRL